MAKEFKDWVDEFVENGANPKDVTNWPEEAGGGSTVVANPELSGDEPDLTGLEVDGAKYKVPQGGGGETYTAGEGINISEDNVISAEKTVVLVNELPNEGEADKLYKLPNGDVYEWAEIETQTDITEISVGKRFILADTINRLDYGTMVNECFKAGELILRPVVISSDLKIVVYNSDKFLVIESNSSPNRYKSYCGFYCNNYYSQNHYWTKREQNFKHYPFIEITQTLIDSISSFGGSIEYIAPLFKKEVTYSYGWSKISNYKLSESLELVDGALSIKNGFVNEEEIVPVDANGLGLNELGKICYLDSSGEFSGFKNCLITTRISKTEGFTEDFSGVLKPESIGNNGLLARFCSGIKKSENGEFRAVVELYYYKDRLGGHTFAHVRKSIEYIMGTLALREGDTITEQLIDSLVTRDTTSNKNLCFKNCFLKLTTLSLTEEPAICYPSEMDSSSVCYRSNIIERNNRKFYYEVNIFTFGSPSWMCEIKYIHEEDKGPVLMPMNAISREALGLDEGSYKIDYAKLADKLAELGIDVDSPWLREEESNLDIRIGGARVSDNTSELIHISADKTGTRGFNISISDDPKVSGSTPVCYLTANNQTIREVLNMINVHQEHVYAVYAVPNYTSIYSSFYAISNEVAVIRPAINDVEYKTIGDVQSFMKDVLVPIGSGSSE